MTNQQQHRQSQTKELHELRPAFEIAPSSRSIASSITCSEAFSEEEEALINRFGFVALTGNDTPLGRNATSNTHRQLYLLDQAPKVPARRTSSNASYYSQAPQQQQQHQKGGLLSSPPAIPIRQPSEFEFGDEGSFAAAAAAAAAAADYADDDSSEAQPLPAVDTVQLHAITSAFRQEQEIFRNHVVIRDRKYHFRTYKRCFVGTEAVDVMLQLGLAKTRAQAVKLGNQYLIMDGLFRHVCGDHPFQDSYLFYHFVQTDDETCGRISRRDHHGPNNNALKWFSSVRGRPQQTIQEEKEEGSY
jgi:hypothetical protein